MHHSTIRYQRASAARGFPKFIAAACAVGILASFSGCTSATSLTKEHVSQSEMVVQQAQQTLGTSEQGALDLQQAKDRLSVAKDALAKNQPQQAERAAAQARLYAELAVAKSQNAAARKAADEVLASLNILRAETERTSPTQQ